MVLRSAGLTPFQGKAPRKQLATKAARKTAAAVRIKSYAMQPQRPLIPHLW